MLLFDTMGNNLIQVNVKGIMPTGAGTAVFLGNDQKTFVIHVDPHMGQALAMHLQKVEKARPLTHDLIGTIFLGLGITLEHIVINDVDKATFFARVILRQKNELGTKLVEIDSRPSDALVLALQSEKPIYVGPKVFSTVEDVTDVLNKIFDENNINPKENEEGV